MTFGAVYVAALMTNVPESEILYYQTLGGKHSAIAGFLQDVLHLRRRDITEKFPGCQAVVAVANDRSGTLQNAHFSYLTVNHGRFSREVAYVRIDKFRSPEMFTATPSDKTATGRITLKVEGDFGVDRMKLRVQLKRNLRSIEEFTCVEDELRLMPVGQYVIDYSDRDLRHALELPAIVDVTADSQQDIRVKLKEGLAPLTVTIRVPSDRKGQYCSLQITGLGQKAIQRRTMGDKIVAWLPPNTYRVTATMRGCKTAITEAVVSSSMSASTSLSLSPE